MVWKDLTKWKRDDFVSSDVRRNNNTLTGRTIDASSNITLPVVTTNITWVNERPIKDASEEDRNPFKLHVTAPDNGWDWMVHSPWDIKPIVQKKGEPKMYEPELPIIYLNRAYMHCEFQHIYNSKVLYKFPRPYLDNRLVRKTFRIVLQIDQSHSHYNIWGIDFRKEPTFQLSLPRNAFTLRLQR